MPQCPIAGDANDDADLRMLGELEDAEDAEDPDEREAAGALGALAVAVRLLDGEDNEVREDRQHVDDVHGVVAELALGRTRREADEELAGKPSNARLHSFISLHGSAVGYSTGK